MGDTHTTPNQHHIKPFSRPVNFSFFLLRKITPRGVDMEFGVFKNELIAEPVEVAIVGVRK